MNINTYNACCFQHYPPFRGQRPPNTWGWQQYPWAPLLPHSPAALHGPLGLLTAPSWRSSMLWMRNWLSVTSAWSPFRYGQWDWCCRDGSGTEDTENKIHTHTHTPTHTHKQTGFCMLLCYSVLYYITYHLTPCPQALSSAGGAECANDSLVSCRTRSKRPLRGIPLGMLEAELHAPDITPDMYDCGLALEDRDWSEWLQGLMISDIEYEGEGPQRS